VIFKPRIGFKAIAVTGGMNCAGEMKAFTLSDYSVNADKFIDFLILLRSQTHGKSTLYVVLDNLSVHHSHKVRDYAERNNTVLVFNAPYSSEYNPIERYWALSKRIFSAELSRTNDLS
jgi:transposase